MSYTDSGKKITTFGQWARAFRIFSSVYLEKPENLHEARALNTYMQNIELMAEKGGDWLGYDDFHRKQRQGTVPPGPWNAYYGAIFSISLLGQSGAQKGKQSFRPRARKPGAVPKSYCFDFHSSGKYCERDPCSYRHQCYICKRGAHPAYSCKRKAAGGGGRSTADTDSNK